MGNHESAASANNDTMASDSDEDENDQQSALTPQEIFLRAKKREKRKERGNKKKVVYKTKITKLHTFAVDVYMSYDLGGDSSGRLIKTRMNAMKKILNKRCKLSTLDYDDATKKYIDLISCEKRITQALNDSCSFIVVLTKNYVRIVNETFEQLSPPLQSSFLSYFSDDNGRSATSTSEDKPGENENRVLLKASIVKQLNQETARIASSSNVVAIEFLIMAVTRGPSDMVPILLEEDVYSSEVHSHNHSKYENLFNMVFKMRLQLECYHFEIVEDEVEKMLMLLNRRLSQSSNSLSVKTRGYRVISRACDTKTEQLHQSLIAS